MIFLVEPLGRGGIAHYTYCLADALSAAGADVTVITADQYEFGRPAGFKVREAFKIRGDGLGPRRPSHIRQLQKARSFYSGVRRLRRQVEKERPGIVHFQGSLPYADWLFSRQLFASIKKSGGRVVYTAHNILPHERRKLHTLIYRHIYLQADSLIVHAQDNLESLGAIEPGHRPATVIPHGDYAFFSDGAGADKKQARERLEIHEDVKTILFFGAIRSYKGLDTLIEACGLIRGEVDKLRLVIAGNPLESFKKYEELIKNAGLSDQVHLRLEYIPNDEVGDYFLAADVVALPYKETYESGVIQIATAFGLPVVCTNTGGLTQYVEEARCGYLVEPGDHRALAKRLREVLSDRSLAEELGANGREFSRSHRSWDSIARQTLAVYGVIDTPDDQRAIEPVGGGHAT